MRGRRSLYRRVFLHAWIVLGVFCAETVGANLTGQVLPLSVTLFFASAGVLVVLAAAVTAIDSLVLIRFRGRRGVWYALAAGVWLLHVYRLDLLASPAPWLIAAGIALAYGLPWLARGVEEGASVFLVALAVSPDWITPMVSPVQGLFPGSYVPAALYLVTAILLVLMVRVLHHTQRSWPAPLGYRSIGILLLGILVLGSGLHGYWVRPETSSRGKFRGTLPAVTLGEETAPEDLPNIILISIDTLRQDLPPPRSSSGLALPGLRELRKDSIVFPHHFTTSSVTHISHASLLSGLLPVRHHPKAHWAIHEDVWLYPQLLRSAGYRTGAFTGGGWVRRQLGFARGFDRYWAYPAEHRELVPGGFQLLEGLVALGGHPLLLRHRRRGRSGRYLRDFRRTVDRGLSWIDRVSGADETRPFFLFLHAYHLHDYSRLYPESLERLDRHHPELLEDGLFLELMRAQSESNPFSSPKLIRDMKTSRAEPYGTHFRHLPVAKRRILKKRLGPKISEQLEKTPLPRSRRDVLQDRILGYVHSRILETMQWLYRYNAGGVDSALRTFFTRLKQKGLYRDSLIVFFSDHGEGFLKESLAWGHGMGQLQDMLVHTPLFVKLPGNRHSRLRREGLVQSTDVFPSVLEHLDIRPVLPGETLPDRPRTDLLAPPDTRGREIVQGAVSAPDTTARWNLYVRSDSYKIVWKPVPRKERWYRVRNDDLSETPVHRKRVPASERQRLRKALDRTRTLYRHHRSRHRPDIKMDEALKQELKGLGYLE